MPNGTSAAVTEAASLNEIIKISCVTVLFLALVFFLPPTVQAGKLEGTVIGRKGDFKKYVRISLFGREPKTTFTDDKGIFTLDAPDGRYGLSISEKGNEQTFEVEIPGRWRFRVDW